MPLQIDFSNHHLFVKVLGGIIVNPLTEALAVGALLSGIHELDSSLLLLVPELLICTRTAVLANLSQRTVSLQSPNGPTVQSPISGPSNSTQASTAEHSCVCGAGFNLAQHYSKHKTTCVVVEQQAQRAYEKQQKHGHIKPNRKRKRTESRGSAASGSSYRRHSSSSSSRRMSVDLEQEMGADESEMLRDTAGDTGFEVRNIMLNASDYHINTQKIEA
jgi:hypothetical protein